MKKCDICGRTEQECRIRTVKNVSFCPKHITQWYRNGSFDDNTIYQPNEYVFHDNYAEIILKDKNCIEVGRAQIDLEDVEKCQKYKWHLRKARNTNYVIASINGEKNKKIHLHRLIMNYYDNLDIDHIDRNGLNNRKSNLRIVTHSMNLTNNDKKGVKLVPSGRWQVVVCRNYKNIYIGTFDTEEEAIQARTDYIKNVVGY